jgi:hypothetical protein
MVHAALCRPRRIAGGSHRAIVITIAAIGVRNKRAKLHARAVQQCMRGVASLQIDLQRPNGRLCRLDLECPA